MIRQRVVSSDEWMFVDQVGHLAHFHARDTGTSGRGVEPLGSVWTRRRRVPCKRTPDELGPGSKCVRSRRPCTVSIVEICDSRSVPNIEERMVAMADGVYRVTEVIGVSDESWEAAARTAVETAAKTVRDLRIAEVLRQDVAIENGKIRSYRVRLAISFKYEGSD
jgi:flavin-binding protein dodecin